MQSQKGNIFALAAVILIACLTLYMSKKTPGGYSLEARSVEELQDEAARLFLTQGYIPAATLRADKMFGQSQVILSITREGKSFTGKVLCAPREPCVIDSIM